MFCKFQKIFQLFCLLVLLSSLSASQSLKLAETDDDSQSDSGDEITVFC